MPTENRSTMVSVQREQLRQFIEYSASACKSPAWVKDKAALLAALDQPAQHQGEPVAAVKIGPDDLAAIDLLVDSIEAGTKLYTRPAPAAQQEAGALEERVCSIATDIQGIRRLLEDLANKRWPDKDHDLTGGYVSASIGHASAGAKYHLPALERALLGLNELLHMPADPGEVERLRAEVKRLQHTSVKEEVFDIVCKERDTLRAHLAERDALLRDFIKMAREPESGMRNDCLRIDAVRAEQLLSGADPEGITECGEFNSAINHQRAFKLSSDTIAAAKWGWYSGRAALERKP